MKPFQRSDKNLNLTTTSTHPIKHNELDSRMSGNQGSGSGCSKYLEEKANSIWGNLNQDNKKKDERKNNGGDGWTDQKKKECNDTWGKI